MKLQYRLAITASRPPQFPPNSWQIIRLRRRHLAWWGAVIAGHTADITCLTACRGAPRILASASRDGTLRTWDVPAGICTSVSPLQATALVAHPSGSCLISGSAQGAMQTWELPDNVKQEPGLSSNLELTPQQMQSKPLVFPEGCHASALNSLIFLDTERLMSRSANGHVTVFSWQQREMLTSWRVQQSSGGCGITATSDGSIVCEGSNSGTIFLYNSYDGTQLATLSFDKVQSTVGACALSDDCCHVLAAAGRGFILRFESLPLEAKADKPEVVSSQPTEEQNV